MVAIVLNGKATWSSIPLCSGLTIVTAISDPRGDYESIKTVESVANGDVNLRYSTEREVNGTLRRLKVHRVVGAGDLRNATLYMHHFDEAAPLRIPGSTAIGTSAAVIRVLKARGEAELAIGDRGSEQMAATIRRVGPRTVSMLVNNRKVDLPAIHARGSYFLDTADFLFLDDEQNPMTLKFRIGTAMLDVVKISYVCAPEGGTAAKGAPRSAIEQALAESGRVDIYNIFFSFNSDVIREESGPALQEIGATLRRRLDWKLAINGHTDNIATDAYNLELSRRRAAAVKSALVTRFGIASSRLNTAGMGEASPKDTNDTLEGRARNRRVELVKQ